MKDNSLENSNTILKEEGIVSLLTTPNTLRQNGVLEIETGILIDIVRSMMSYSIL